jgi:hypothetical protein
MEMSDPIQKNPLARTEHTHPLYCREGPAIGLLWIRYNYSRDEHLNTYLRTTGKAACTPTNVYKIGSSPAGLFLRSQMREAKAATDRLKIWAEQPTCSQNHVRNPRTTSNQTKRSNKLSWYFELLCGNQSFCAGPFTPPTCP